MVIERDTPLAFVDFLRAEGSDANLRRVVYLNSRGGDVVASMDFGRILRELRMAAIVGRFEGDGAEQHVGKCVSACVYAMMGAVKRVAPPGSEVALHRMSVVETEGGFSGDSALVARSHADPPMVAVLKRYARRMGVNPRWLVRQRRSPLMLCTCSHARKCTAGHSRLANSEKSGSPTPSPGAAHGRRPRATRKSRFIVRVVRSRKLASQMISRAHLLNHRLSSHDWEATIFACSEGTSSFGARPRNAAISPRSAGRLASRVPA